ncbi:hypothetical protein [uncultured Agrobacterium sp.]|uniref:hypothetical protein n=1 Tax=uncultured Agrobacterium sp. TaxID=157277 RepID=UPI0025F48EE7|nr:hypothetical protein [uncultured Agrobacterium sp.]
MKLFSAAICLISVGILSGCVDDRGYRSGGYYSTGVYYRTYERDRYYRNYDRRDWRDRRYHHRHRPPVYGGVQQYGVIVR